MFSPSRIVLAAAIAILVDAAALSTVTLDYGTFTGLTDTTSGIIYFRGVRYADPPVGALRWRAAVSPPTTHLGNVNATAFGDACIATSQAAVTSSTSEDCLFGNVYVPIATTARSALPVLIYFHEPPSTVDKPLIFVTFNYRLGQFGFLGGTAVHDHGLLNAGLLDQKAALVWVQKYIKKFGAIPNVSLSGGKSAGAGATMFHLVGEGGANGNKVQGDSPSLERPASLQRCLHRKLFSQFASLAGCSGPLQHYDVLTRRAHQYLGLAGSQTLANRTSSFYPFDQLQMAFSFKSARRSLPFWKFARVPVLFGP
ncbi:Alpha/Beta hydrolase protein [Mycena haematopus]|nr:Alpha/Beta hydrolase protein [Mycena haematopus]